MRVVDKCIRQSEKKQACNENCVNPLWGERPQEVFMLINRDELSRKVLDGELTSLDDLNSVLRAMIMMWSKRPWGPR